ncbi:MAG: EAL domain-containing protein [Betaproteobacteria bacterium]|nr:EAL domain-containing protein [Betaproteobacteria bacterium]
MTPQESSAPFPGAAPPAANTVREEQVRLLFRFSLVGYLATLLVVFILGAILWEQLASAALFAWFVAIALVTIARYGLYKSFVARDPPAADLPVWERRFLAGTLLAGLAWATIGTVLLPDTVHLAERYSVVMLVSLLVTGAVGYYAPHPYAYKITAFLGLVPVALVLGSSGDRAQMFLSGAILMLAGVLPFVHEKVNRALVDSLALRRERAVLTLELDDERSRLQQANEALADEMLGRLKAQQAELLAAQKLRMHVERTPLAVIEWDREHRITAWNPAAEAIFGFTEDDARGRLATELIIGPTGREGLIAMWRELETSRDGTKITLDNVTRAGRSIHCEWYNTPLVDPGGRVVGYASLVQDVTERLNTERTIHYMAHHDALTGLPNRRLMQDRLNQAIMQARRKQRHVAVLFIDLDRFKLVNDTLGHDSGDYVLKDVARRLASCVREVDTVSREGGDEFVIVLPDLEKPESARIVAEKILRELAKPMDIGGQEVHVTPSIGISHYPNDATDVNHLLKHADTAMYQAKDAGRNTVRFFTGDLNFLLAKRLEVEVRLRKAIENEEFFLRYQPQVEIATGRITGMEALLRWNDPERGEILPKDFVFVAEELGLIVQLGEWAFRTACRQLRVWADEGIADVAVSVNISPRQFMSRHLVPSLLAIVRETGADPHRIELEITETMIMRNLDQSIEVLRQLRSVGMRVSVDDFGVGYSSLGQLARLPANALKIDKSFVSQAVDDPSSGSITEAIIAMARRLKLRVTAEGVETRPQLEFLRANQCDAFQGYLFSRPVTALEATAMLRAQQAGPRAISA